MIKKLGTLIFTILILIDASSVAYGAENLNGRILSPQEVKGLSVRPFFDGDGSGYNFGVDVLLNGKLLFRENHGKDFSSRSLEDGGAEKSAKSKLKALETQVAKLQAARLGGTISMSGNDWIWIEQEEHVKSIARLAKENAELKMRLDAAELKELQSKQAEIEKRNEQFQKQVDGLEIVSSQH